MKVQGQNFRTIWLNPDKKSVGIIDQTKLPHRFETLNLTSVEMAAHAILTMQVRGAPLIGVTAAYGLALKTLSHLDDESLKVAGEFLKSQRPTAINLAWAVDHVLDQLLKLEPTNRQAAAFQLASDIAEDDVETCRLIGVHGSKIIEDLWQAKGQPKQLNILTHCNAGWLATVDWGTALSPIFQAFDAGIPVFVWVDETRPRNQGAALTAWELNAHGVPHRVIVDNAGGLFMMQGKVDMVITGTDRTCANGDVCNKIGTYLKALAAFDNNVPFYVALPHSTIDWNLANGNLIPIEERAASEVTHIMGKLADGNLATIQLTPDGVEAANPAFDVTPARLVTGLITERGVCKASKAGLLELYPEKTHHP